MKRWILILVALALALSGVEGIALAQDGQARLRAVHAVPDGPPLNVSVGDIKAFTDVMYKDVTDYAGVNAGTQTLRVAPTDSPESPVIDVQANLQPNVPYSLVAVGRPDQIESLLLADDNSAPPQGKARVRFVHVSPNAPAVDVALQGGNVLFTNVPYKGVGGYVLLDAGTYTLEVREAGTCNVILTVPGVVLESCDVYTIWAMGLLNEQPPLESVVSTDAITNCAVATSAVTAAATATKTATPATKTATPATKTATLATKTATATGTKTATATGTKTATPATKTATATGTKTATLATKTATATGTKTATLATKTATATGTKTATPATKTATATGTKTATLATKTATSATKTATAATKTATPATKTATPATKTATSATKTATAATKTATSATKTATSATKAPTKKITLKVTKPPITVVTKAPTSSTPSILEQATQPASQPTAAPQQQPQQPQGGGGQGE